MSMITSNLIPRDQFLRTHVVFHGVNVRQFKLFPKILNLKERCGPEPQIGNAVPPRLAEIIVEALISGHKSNGYRVTTKWSI